MEAAGLAIGVVGLAGLFNTCLDAIHRAQSYRSFASDAKALDLQFNATKVRFENWGRAVGILDVAQAANGIARHHPALDDANIQRATLEIFDFVKGICKSTGAEKSGLGAAVPSQPANSTRRKLAWALEGKLRRTEQVELFKELVQTLYNLVPPDDYEAGAPVVNAWSVEFSQIVSRLETQAGRDVHAWLCHVPGERYRDSIQRRLDGTCLWIFQEQRFLQWKSRDLSSGPKILWIHGPAGFGKTVLCASIVQHLTTKLDTPTAHFFFSSEAGSRDDPFLAVRSWVSQVISCNDGAFRLALQRQESDSDPIATRHTIMSIFGDLVRLIPGCTFVLDGLDECTNIEGSAPNSAVAFLGAVRHATAGTKTRLLVVSRFLSGIKHALQGGNPFKLSELKLRSKDVQADIVAYSRDIVDKKLQSKSVALRTSLSDAMAERCKGQFLWLRLQGESLRRGLSQKQLEETVKDTPIDLINIYNHDWIMITQLKGADKNRAFSLLRWAAFSSRPLSIYEVSEAMLVEKSHKRDVHELSRDIDTDYVDTEIVGLCGSLLEVDMGTKPNFPGCWKLCLSHFTVREFLASKLPTPGWIVSGNLQPSSEMLHHALLAEVCLRYISLPEVWTLPLTPDSHAFGTSFRSYATCTWFHHASSGVPTEPTLMELAMEFFKLENPSWVSWSTLKVAIEAQDAGNTSTEALRPPSLRRPIHSALSVGMPDLAASLMRSQGCVPEDLDATGYSAFRSACVRGPASLVEAMIEQGADTCSIGNDGWSPLHLAASGGHVDVASTLLAHNADARAVTKIGSPLNIAASADSVDLVKLLLKHGAYVNAIDADGFTVVHKAVEADNLSMLETILEHKADPNAVKGQGRGLTPLSYAATLGRVAATKMLLHHGANPTVANTNGGRPLNLAVAHSHLDIVKPLLEHNADPDAADEYGDTPLGYAVSLGHESIVEALIHHGANATTANNKGNRPLSMAVTTGHLNIIKLLLKHRADPDAADEGGWYPLCNAAFSGHERVVEVLLRHGANVTMACANGRTPLDLAASRGHLNIIKLLLHHGASINFNNSPLSLAAWLGQTAVVRLLLDAAPTPTALVNGLDSLGRSPLFFASRSGRLPIVRILLEAGADQLVIDWGGWTPLSAAVHCGHLRVASLLRDFKAGLDKRAKRAQDEIGLDVSEAGTEPELAPPFCDACLLDVPLCDGQTCALCSHVACGFYLCAKCYGAKTGCLDPSHEFWPKETENVESVE